MSPDLTKTTLQSTLQPFGQEHLLTFWDQLDEAGRERLRDQFERIDLSLVAALVQGAQHGPNWSELADRAMPPRAIRRGDPHNEFSPSAAKARGEAAIRAGSVGMMLVAGGQGTRLGFRHPKGMLKVGPLSSRSLFEIMIDRLRAVATRYGVSIPLYIMTSPATHRETDEFLAENERFGLPASDVRLFCQGVMPAVDAATGKILLAGRDQLSLNPDGHGGMLTAWAASGCHEDALRRGVRHLYYGQIDNPLLLVCDPELIGYHLLAESEMTTQVVAKRDPLDRVGNVAIIDGSTQIIEYSDLPEAAARRRNADGSLFFWAGSIAIHVFEASFLNRMVHHRDGLPFHRAHKKSPFIDAAGNRVEPTSPNSIKFERFIFDLLPFARCPIVVEAPAEEVFAPVKNAADAKDETIATAQAAMIARDKAMFQAAGVKVAEGVPIEVNPRWALDAEEVSRKLRSGSTVDQATYFV